jgi:hypothetical protein
LRDEAISSWIARIAARYDVSPYDLVQYVLPGEDGYAELYRWIDSRVAHPLEAAISNATGLPVTEFAVRRLPGLTSDPRTAWPRRTPAWCPRCVIQDMAEFGEVHSRREWGFGGYLVCPEHNRLLSSACPRCFQQIFDRPIDGRLRLWCSACCSCVDLMPELRAIRTWPPNSEPFSRRCKAVSISSQARTLLLQVQADLLLTLAGGRGRGHWARWLKNDRVLEILRQFSFVMLGPLGEASYRAAPGRDRKRIEGPPADDWHPGQLPPEVSLPTLLACVMFLASESDVSLAGMNWDRRVLADGEGCRINAETLLWHLTYAEGETLQRMFTKPIVRPFSTLLSAWRADQDGVAAEHEAKRRRWKLHKRDKPGKRPAKPAAWGSREAASTRPAARYALARFLPPTIPSWHGPRPSRAHHEAAAAVYMAFGTDPSNDAVDLAKYAGTLFGNRYIHFWLLRHLHLPVEQLIETLGSAVAVARAEDRGVILPEIPESSDSKALADAPPAAVQTIDPRLHMRGVVRRG